ncbi:putative bifunctional diguanylate cyclase/phosphodiesterase [Hydrogenimonas cancrithermarum]|uniref:Diguanylate cyclase/phosphodiesterase n=1 Tax=Hydrogenimonas cancrithermarum TaxID=2993563 RepID=A0ABM8FKW4_9BACT|nr:EAL domain-containing protein [Hydrogenimonas cancrithermarum]BDY12833.1 hypothetical protein HCR_11450 [Hydrogenimonas cancrithermarum]BDY12950.1 hypothetical protein HCR_12620 [Hydrogenimonas cancrithermarum]
MNRLFAKVGIALTAALLGIGIILYQQNSLKESFGRIESTNQTFQKLHTDIVTLQHTVLQANYFLYFNTDRILQESKTITNELQSLEKKIRDNADYYPYTLHHLRKTQALFAKRVETIHDFLTLNASLKNSFVYLPTLARKAYTLFDITKPLDREIILLLSKINTSLFLAKNALDESFVEELHTYEKELAGYLRRIGEKRKARLLEASYRHLNVFVSYFPRFHKELNEILDKSMVHSLEKTFRLFSKESKKELDHINTIGNVFLLIYLGTILVVIYFIIHSEKENIRLKKMRDWLEKSLVTDPLTGLLNREAYHHRKNLLSKPALILLNIDRFKHINEFYGAAIGDAVLQECTKRLKTLLQTSQKASLYRLGGDDFGVLFEYENQDEIEALIGEIFDSCDNTSFEINGLVIDISMSAGASTAKERLLETADMALKAAKSSRRSRYLIFNPSMDVSETIARNIHAIQQLKTAIANDEIFPYFQPIVDLESGKTVKYEALARMRTASKEVLTPYHFLEAAKQAKLSGTITATILRQTLETARQSGAHFSVNISSGDIASSYDKKIICGLLHEYEEIADRITFEILESEEIEDYELVADFLNRVRHHGCKIAIDDFGSGYSNFEKLLQLDIDFLKIDGSLIKNIDHDTHAELIVRTIVEFAKGAGIETVAEFVHSEAVLRKVKSLGIGFGQGFFLGKPLPFSDCPECQIKDS